MLPNYSISLILCYWYTHRDKVDVAARLFDALKLEAQYLRLILQEATNSLAIAYKVLYQLVYFILSLLCISISALMETCFESQDAPLKVLKDVELLLLQNSEVVCALICLLACAVIIFSSSFGSFLAMLFKSLRLSLTYSKIYKHDIVFIFFITRNKVKYAFVL